MGNALSGSPQYDCAGAYICESDTAEQRWMGEVCTRFLATADSTGGQFCVVDETAAQGETVPLHRHVQDVESFYVIAGKITFFIGDAPGVTAGAHSFVHVPGGTVHGFRIASDTARDLIFTTARHGEFYRAISQPAAPGLPAHPEVDWDRVMAAAREFGVELVGELPAA